MDRQQQTLHGLPGAEQCPRSEQRNHEDSRGNYQPRQHGARMNMLEQTPEQHARENDCSKSDQLVNRDEQCAQRPARIAEPDPCADCQEIQQPNADGSLYCVRGTTSPSRV